MFGEKLDTKLLRYISHDRNLMTEEQIEAEADSLHELKTDDFDRFTTRSENHFDWKGKDILDVACGQGDLANCLAARGASDVRGIDIDSSRIRVAQSVAKREDIKNVHFVADDFLEFETQERFDYVVSYEALDHVPNAKDTLEKMAGLLKPGGRIINFSAGFWLGPFADHCQGFMRFFIPWRHLIFEERALLNVRREKYRPTDPATRFEDIRGGLSKYTLSGYQQAIRDVGLTVVRFDTNYQFRYRFHGMLYPMSSVLTRLPLLGEYFTFSAFVVLTKDQ